MTIVYVLYFVKGKDGRWSGYKKKKNAWLLSDGICLIFGLWQKPSLPQTNRMNFQIIVNFLWLCTLTEMLLYIHCQIWGQQMLSFFILYITKLLRHIDCHFKYKGLCLFIGMHFIVSNFAYHQVKQKLKKCQSHFLKLSAFVQDYSIKYYQNTIKIFTFLETNKSRIFTLCKLSYIHFTE